MLLLCRATLIHIRAAGKQADFILNYNMMLINMDAAIRRTWPTIIHGNII